MTLYKVNSVLFIVFFGGGSLLAHNHFLLLLHKIFPLRFVVKKNTQISTASQDEMIVAQFTLPTEANKRLNDTYKNKQTKTTVPGYWASVLRGGNSQVTEKIQ